MKMHWFAFVLSTALPPSLPTATPPPVPALNVQLTSEYVDGKMYIHYSSIPVEAFTISPGTFGSKQILH